MKELNEIKSQLFAFLKISTSPLTSLYHVPYTNLQIKDWQKTEYTNLLFESVIIMYRLILKQNKMIYL